LKKVQRALKTLGVNFLHFDDQTAEKDSAKSGEGVNSGNSCDKEYCRMGCVCDSVTGKYTFDAVGLSEILKGKQKVGVTFHSDKLVGNDLKIFSKLTFCRASEA
jgi:hypothetical protein